MRRRLAAILAFTVLVWLPSTTTPPAVHAATACTTWTSTRVPPPTIKVLRTSGPASQHVQTVDFKAYVKTVIAAEWPPTYPTAAIRAGAVAVKQYAWYYVLHYRGGTSGGSCYDVVDNTNDQIYRPESRTPSAAHISAVEGTWTKSVTKTGSFLLTGYRPGAWVGCGLDVDGWHMFQHSAYSCAQGGMDQDQILRLYYGPGAIVWTPPRAPTAIVFSPPAQDQLTNGTSATVSWLEGLTAGTSITFRSATLEMGKPLSGQCKSDRWLPAIPAWQSTDASPQTVTGLMNGYCYRFVIDLTDSNGVTTHTQSGTILVDELAPTVTFTSPPSDAVTPLTANSTTVTWAETPANGASIASRRLTTEYAAQPISGSCAGAQWQTLNSTTSGTPVNVTGLMPLYCYRFRVDLTDSAGHSGSWVSGVAMTPAAF